MSIPTTVESPSQERSHHILPSLGMIISAQFSASGFAKNWTHCNRLANYLARYASANESDPERQSTLLSTFFNEVLEVIHRNQSGTGQVKLVFRRKGRYISLWAEIPVDDRSRKFYQRAVELVNQPDLDAWYREWLERTPGGVEEEGGDIESAALGLLELVAVYDSVLKIQDPSDGGPMVLSFEFPCESEDME